MNDNIHRDQRRTHLFKTYNFICVCPACDLSEEQLQVQNKLCDEFNTLMIKKKAFEAMNVSAGYSINNGNTWKELICLKELYKIAKGLKFFRRAEILEQIVEEGFDAACQGYLTMCEIGKTPNARSHRALVTEKKTNFWKDVCNFAKDGLEISTTVHGPEHSKTIEWRKREEDPVKYFKDENQADPHTLKATLFHCKCACWPQYILRNLSNILYRNRNGL